MPPAPDPATALLAVTEDPGSVKPQTSARRLLEATEDPGSVKPPPPVSRKLTETHETPQGEAARLARERTVLHFSLGFIVLIFALCAYTGLFNPNATESDKKWSFAVIGAMTGPVIAYVFKALS